MLPPTLLTPKLDPCLLAVYKLLVFSCITFNYCCCCCFDWYYCNLCGHLIPSFVVSILWSLHPVIGKMWVANCDLIMFLFFMHFVISSFSPSVVNQSSDITRICLLFCQIWRYLRRYAAPLSKRVFLLFLSSASMWWRCCCLFISWFYYYHSSSFSSCSSPSFALCVRVFCCCYLHLVYFCAFFLLLYIYYCGLFCFALRIWFCLQLRCVRGRSDRSSVYSWVDGFETFCIVVDVIGHFLLFDFFCLFKLRNL